MNELDTCPVFCLYAASRKLMKIYTIHLKNLDLTYTQYLVISYVLDNDECSLDNIGKALFLDSGTLTPLLKRLEANNLIMRLHSSEDERKRVIKLTSHGRDLKKMLDPLRQEIRNKFHLNYEEIQHLMKTLNKILSTNF